MCNVLCMVRMYVCTCTLGGGSPSNTHFTAYEEQRVNTQPYLTVLPITESFVTKFRCLLLTLDITFKSTQTIHVYTFP